MSNENAPRSGQGKYAKLAGNTLIFAISSFSSKLLTLIVQPFLTYAMAEISDLGLSKILSPVRKPFDPLCLHGYVQCHHPLWSGPGQQQKAGVHQWPAEHSAGVCGR